MSYSTTYTKKTAIEKIKEQEIELSNLAWTIRTLRKDYRAEIAKLNKDHKTICAGIENGSEVARLKEDVQTQIDLRLYETRQLNFQITELKKDNDHEDNSLSDMRGQNMKLKKEAVQFRKTQDYQSGEIGRLQTESVHYQKCYKRVNSKLVIMEDRFKDTDDAKNKQKIEFNTILKEALSTIENRGATIIRQANEITELRCGA